MVMVEPTPPGGSSHLNSRENRSLRRYGVSQMRKWEAQGSAEWPRFSFPSVHFINFHLLHGSFRVHRCWEGGRCGMHCKGAST